MKFCNATEQSAPKPLQTNYHKYAKDQDFEYNLSLIWRNFKRSAIFNIVSQF